MDTDFWRGNLRVALEEKQENRKKAGSDMECGGLTPPWVDKAAEAYNRRTQTP